MSYQPLYQTSLSLDTINWTPLVLPASFMVLYVLNPPGNPSVKRRTTAGDPNTEITIAAGQEESASLGGSGSRFPVGATLAFYQAVSGAPSVDLVGVAV